MRATMLDELEDPMLRRQAKGLKESTMLFRYPVRVAIKPYPEHSWLDPAASFPVKQSSRSC